jgi:hypothetical protein
VIHPNTVAYSAGAVACPDYDSAMRHRDRGEYVTWFNTGRPHRFAAWFSHVGQMVARPEGFR